MKLRDLIQSMLHPHPPAREQHRHDLLASLLVMAWIVEARDPYTGGHLWRVSRYAELVAERAGLTEAHVACAAIGGFLHDLGKIGIPDAILRKPERLTDTEYEIVRTHPEAGERILAGHPLAALVRDAVACHHERPDGKGYPRGLNGDQIPLDARIVGVCDAFDAMTSTRPYRAGMSIEVALGHIERGRGRQFDPVFADALLSMRDGTILEHIAGHSDDGIPLRNCVMCGPTLVMLRENAPGDLLYCRSCGGEYRLIEDDQGQLDASPSGKMGDARALTARADLALIARVVRDAVSRTHFSKLLDTIPMNAN